MKVLVGFATRMGSTAEIAEAVAEQLREAGHHVKLRPVAGAPEPKHYDAVVIGSAIYSTRWDKAARHYLERNKAALAARPTWLFESGPCGDVAGQRHGTQKAILRLAEDIGCSPPQVFGGNLDPKRATSRLEKWVANSDLAGDYRDWEAIRAWGEHILAGLKPAHPSGK